MHVHQKGPFALFFSSVKLIRRQNNPKPSAFVTLGASRKANEIHPVRVVDGVQSENCETRVVVIYPIIRRSIDEFLWLA